MFCSYESCIHTYTVHTTSNGTKLLLEGLGCIEPYGKLILEITNRANVINILKCVICIN